MCVFCIYSFDKCDRIEIYVRWKRKIYKGEREKKEFYSASNLVNFIRKGRLLFIVTGRHYFQSEEKVTAIVEPSDTIDL